MKNSIFTAFATVAIVLAGTTASNAAYFSWEGTTDGWFSDFSTGIETAVAVDVAGGAPAAAITDGDYALAIGRTGTTWTQVARVDQSSSAQADFLRQMRANTTIDLDLFIPVESYGGNWAGFEFLIQGQLMTGGLTLKKQININGPMTDPVGEAYHLTWEYGAQFNDDTNWTQFSVAVQGGGTMNPAYIDNFRFSGAGDYNLNGTVDAADYTLWRDNRGATDESSINNRGDRKNGVDSVDYDLWVGSFGKVTSTEANPVSIPEPTSIAMLVLACCVGVSRRR